MNEFPKASTSGSDCFSKCNTNLRAVFRPIPGNLANSLTAFSSKDEEYCWLLIDVFSMLVQIYKKNRFKTIFVQGILVQAFFVIFVRINSFRVLNIDLFQCLNLTFSS